MQTRPYQEEAFDGIITQLNDNASTLLVMATGTGKTFVFSLVAKEFMRWGRVMVLGDRDKVVYQAASALTKITGCEPDIEMGDYHAVQGRNRAQIVCGTFQTQLSGMNGKGRMTKFDPDEFAFLITDEAHHAAAAGHRRVIEYYQQNRTLKHLGVTATPDRKDEKPLGQVYDTVAYEYELLQAIEDGYLVRIDQEMMYVHGLDFSKCRVTAGDLNGKDRAQVMEEEKPLHEMVSTTIQHIGDKKALVFAASLAHAERMTEIFNRPDNRPGSAKWIHGKTPDDVRRLMYSDYADGLFQYFVNVGITTESYDEPTVMAIIQGRPTLSRSWYAQAIGRVTRTWPGTIDGISDPVARRSAIALSPKPYAHVLDFVGNSGRHHLVSAVDILGGNYNDDIVKRAKKNIQEAKKPLSVMEELKRAQKQLEAEAISNDAVVKRERITARAKYSTAKVNPFNVFDLEPVREKGWDAGRRPSAKQIGYLRKCGIDPAGLSFTHAGQLIDRVVKNRETGLCTFKQAKCLSRFNYDPKDITFKKAGELINAIASNDWKRPK